MSCLEVDNENDLMKFNHGHKKGVWFVWYHADWCGHCKNMIPEWDELKNNNKHGVNLAKVRDDYIPRIDSNPPVQGYPTIMLYKNGNIVGIYRGERSGAAFNNYLGENVSPGENSGMNSGIDMGNNNSVELKKPKKKKKKSSKKKSAKSSSNNSRLNNNKKKTSKKSKKAKKSKKTRASNKNNKN